MIKEDVSAHMATLTLQEFDETTTREAKRLNRLGIDLFLTALGFLVVSGACLYFDMPIIAGALILAFLFFTQHSIAVRLEASMLESNWWLALLIQRQSNDLLRQSNDLLAIRQKLGIVDEEEEKRELAAFYEEKFGPITQGMCKGSSELVSEDNKCESCGAQFTAETVGFRRLGDAGMCAFAPPHFAKE